MEEKNVMTDEQLAIDYMAGDNKAFDELLRRYKNKVFSSVYNPHHCGPKGKPLYQQGIF